jgi:hypothetical protein
MTTAGGSVTLNAGSTARISGGTLGAGNLALTGSTAQVSGTVTLTGSATLTASAGNISGTINDAASVTANATNPLGSVSVSLGSTSATTPLNATTITATTPNCFSSSSCSGASVSLSGTQGVNVGTVTASAPNTTNVSVPFNTINESVSITSTAGSIRAMSPASRVTAADVTLSTSAGSGGGIGLAATPLQVDVERSFTFQPNGEFAVQLVGSGPNRFTFNPGVAPAGQTWTGTLTRAGTMNIAASATDTTVTLGTFSITGGFDDLVFNQTPFINVGVPNGSLVVNNMFVPRGDQTGRDSPFDCCVTTIFQALPVTVSASQALTVNNFARDASARPQTTTFTASGGTLTLGTIASNSDAFTASGRDTVSVTSLSGLGSISITSSPQATASGNLDVGSVTSTNGSVTLTASSGLLSAQSDGAGLEVSAAGNLSITAASVGSSGFTRPFDVAGNSVSINANGSGAGTGYIGSGSTPTNPLTATTTSLTLNARGQFNVDTGTLSLQNLTVTARPSGVGAGGLAQVRTGLLTIPFVSDGTNFSLSNLSTTTQFSGGTLDFRSTSGRIDFGNLDFSATNGGLTLRALGNGTGSIAQTAGPFTLGTGFLDLRADGSVTLLDVSAGGMSVSNANGSIPGPGGCAVFDFSTRCGAASLTAGDITSTSSGGFFSATTRGAINVGSLQGDASWDFVVWSGGITTGAIGSAGQAARAVFLNTDNHSGGGAIVTGALQANEIGMNGRTTLTTGAINSLNAAATSVDISARGAINTGSINAAATGPVVFVALRSNASITTGSVDGTEVSADRICCGVFPALNLGAIGGNLPAQDVRLYGTAVSVGAITLDPAVAGYVDLSASGNLTLAGAITAGDGAFARLVANNTGPLQFDRIDVGAAGQVQITNATGINQMLPAASGGGIRAGAVRLTASAGDIISAGAAAGPDNSRITLRGTTDLVVDGGGAMRFNLVDAAGASPGPALLNLDLRRTDNSGAFVLDGLPAPQSLSVTDAGSTTTLAFNSGGTSTSFRYRAAQSATNVTATSIATSGGRIRLETTDGNISATTLDGGEIYIQTGGNGTVRFDGVANAGSQPLIVDSARNIFGTGSAQLRSTNRVTLTARDNLGIIGDEFSSARLAVQAPRVQLDGAEIAAQLTDTTDLRVRSVFTGAGTPGIDVATNTALTDLDLTASSNAGRSLAISAPGQTFGITLTGTGMEVTGSTSAAPLNSLYITSANSNLRVTGTRANLTDASQFDANYLELNTQGAGNVLLDGSTAAVVIRAPSGFQSSSAGAWTFTGRGRLESSSSMLIDSVGGQPVLVQAGAGGVIELAAAYLEVDSGADLSILAGTAAGETVTVSTTQGLFLNSGQDLRIEGGPAAGTSVSITNNGSSAQEFFAARDVIVTGGNGAGATVTLSNAGSSDQEFFAQRNLQVTGGDGAGSAVSVVNTSSGQQQVSVRGNIVLTGGGGTNAAVEVRQSGGGRQFFGDGGSVDPTNNITLQGGSAPGASVLVRNGTSNRQFVLLDGTLTLSGGSADDTFARIQSDNTASGSVSISSAPQVIGYDTASPIFDCCSIVEPNSIVLTGGLGTDAVAEIVSAGAQRLRATGAMTLTGSSATGGHAIVQGLAQFLRAGALTLQAGSGEQANAFVRATGTASDTPFSMPFGALQYVSRSGLTLTGGGTAGSTTASALLASGGTQRIDGGGTTTLTGGSGPDSIAHIQAVGNQTLALGNTTLTGGTDTGANAEIASSAGSQSLNFGSLTLNGGTVGDSGVLIAAATGQTITSGVTALNGGTGVAGNASAALIRSDGGNQSVATSTLNVRSGADYGQAGIVNFGGNQQVSGITIQVTTSAGANTVDAPFAGSYHSGIFQLGTGTQSISGGNVTIDNVHTAGGVGIVNRGVAQSFNVSGALNVLASGGAGGAAVDSSGPGIVFDNTPGQGITASGGILVRSSAGTGAARIVSSAGNQVFSATGGGVRVQVTGGSGSAQISSPGTQRFTVQNIEVGTGATATGNAEITAGGGQTITTTNGITPGFSIKVASLGTGTSRIEAGGNQLIEADYPFLMQAARDGRIFIGDPAATGPSFIRGINQDIFARAILIRGGSTVAGTAKLDASGTQTISILTPSAIPAGITVAGGAGGFASLDPTVQTIVSNGQIQVLGGSGPGTYGWIFSSGPQTIVVTAPGTANSVLIQGGSGSNAFAAITTPDPVMVLGTSGGITLTGGAGTNADAVFGNGPSNVASFACGGAFTCSFAGLTGDPFANALVDVGIANNGVLVPLSSLAAAPPLGPGGSGSTLFDFTSLLLSLRDQSDRTLEGDEESELILSLFGRRLPLCR